MKIQKTIAIVVSVAQTLAAVLAIIFACMLHFNFLDLQTQIGSTGNLLNFHLSLLATFGFLSLINGLFLLSEHARRR